MSRLAAAVAASILLTIGASCKQSKHAHLASYTPAPLPAGYEERSGTEWRIAVPSTWQETAQKGPTAWTFADPQRVDEYRANVSILTEAFEGESYDYATASEAALRRDPRATVEATREEVVDGDPTLLIESHWAPAPPSTVVYRTMQSALASRGVGYVVTCSVASIAFERYRSTCQSIVMSFAVQR